MAIILIGLSVALGFLCGYGTREAISRYRRARARALRLDIPESPADRTLLNGDEDQRRSRADYREAQLQPSPHPEVPAPDEIRSSLPGDGDP